MKLEGRGIVVTGGSQGLGRAIAEACVAEGAHVFVCSRSEEDLKRSAQEIGSRAGRGQIVGSRLADVSRPDDVRRLIEAASRELPRIDGLVNNAGIYGPMGPIEDVDWDAWVRAIEINLMGTVLLCRAVVPLFRKRGYGKIVNLSGGGATAPLPRLSAYAASKAAVVRFTETLAEETRDAGIDVNAIAPGALDTRLLDEAITAGPDKIGREFYERMLKIKAEGGTPLEKGAALSVFLLSAESDGISGRLISAAWDRWEELPSRKADLKGDVFTLRRIVPKDRGLNWS